MGKEQIPPRETQCSEWISQKHRYCNLPRMPGMLFCGNHQLVGIDGQAKRVPCPYTKSHTVSKDKYKKHTFNCSFRPPVEHPAWFELDINSGSENRVPEVTIKNMETLSLQDFDEIKRQIISLHSSLNLGPYRYSILTHPALNARMAETNNGKHATQQSSLIGNLDKLGILQKDNAFIEFGCGSGEFTRYIFEAVEPLHSILVDRKKIKLKVSILVIQIGSDIKTKSWQRVVMDIKDLKLSQLMEGHSAPLVAISKHLCGCATDLTLRCLFNYQNNGGFCQGLVIALCCHQNCTYESYINPEYLRNLGIKKSLFEYVALFSTWALCGPSRNEEKKEHWTGLTYPERQILGFKCKRILDQGRLEMIRKSPGISHAELVYYVDPKTSLENMCILAKWNKL